MKRHSRETIFTGKSQTETFCFDDEYECLLWLSKNGGGTYINELHKFSFKVYPNEFK